MLCAIYVVHMGGDRCGVACFDGCLCREAESKSQRPQINILYIVDSIEIHDSSEMNAVFCPCIRYLYYVCFS